MKANNGKIGLAGRIREIMKDQPRSVSRTKIYETLGLTSWAEKQKALSALQDFEKRKEIVRTHSGRLKYNKQWRRADKSPLKDKIQRAMWVQGGRFAVSDIRRLIDGAEKNYIEKIIRRLAAAGYIRIVGRRICAHRSGIERLYNVTDRVRFRIEVMR